MNIVIDENIPDAEARFGCFGDLRVLPGRSIDRLAVRDAEILLVRSVTRVDSALLEGSRLRFVGTCTAGIDHVDTAALAARGIRFASAPGSNADSVVDYVLSSLAVALPAPAPLPEVGIVGCGQVGGRLLARLRALGVNCRVFDPFVTGIAEAAPLLRVLQCPVISLHVPLTHDGPHPTFHLLDAQRLDALRDDALLLNTARGEVVDNTALLAALGQRTGMRAVLDVWEPEPALDPALLERCLLGTAHIAGYALDGKRRGVEQVRTALCAFLGAEEADLASSALPPAGELPVRCSGWREAALACYDPRLDDARLRDAVVADPTARARAFDRLRRDYPPRREFSAWRMSEAAVHADELRAAGFRG